MRRTAAHLCTLLVAAWLTGVSSPAAEAAEAAEAATGADQAADARMPDATPDADEAARPPPAPRNQPPARERQSGAAPRRSSDDVFRPSEEISEDLAVSYPVDI